MWINPKAVLRWLWPGDTLKFYENYFRSVDLVVDNVTNERAHLAVVGKIYLIIVILLLKSAHLFFLGLYQMEVLGQLVHYNVFYFLFPEIAPQLNLTLALGGVASARYYYIFYFNVHPSLNEVLREVIIKENGRLFFLFSFLSGGDINNNNNGKNDAAIEQQEKRVVERVRTFASKLLKYLRFFLLFAGKVGKNLSKTELYNYILFLQHTRPLCHLQSSGS